MRVNETSTGCCCLVSNLASMDEKLYAVIPATNSFASAHLAFSLREESFSDSCFCQENQVLSFDETGKTETDNPPEKMTRKIRAMIYLNADFFMIEQIKCRSFALDNSSTKCEKRMADYADKNQRMFRLSLFFAPLRASFRTKAQRSKRRVLLFNPANRPV